MQVGEKVCHPVVLVKLNGVTWRDLLDSGAIASNVSGYILNQSNRVLSHTLTHQYRLKRGTVTKRKETYIVQLKYK